MTDDSERWLPVRGYEGLYEVSDAGRVRSLDRIVSRNGGQALSQGRILRATNSGGYGLIRLNVNKVERPVKVHVLVLESFVGPRPAGMCACHINGNSQDNRLENLRWDTPSSNTVDTIRHGTHHNASKTHCKRGHEFTPENTGRQRTGRWCRQCLWEKRNGTR